MNTTIYSPRLERRRVRGRRFWFAVLVAATVGALGWRTFGMLEINGLDPYKIAMLVLTVTLLVPIALSFWTAVIGFIVQWRGNDPLELTRTLGPLPGPDLLLPRTAVIMPIYNEDPVRVFAGLKATYESLDQTGLLRHFDFFLLSDTTDPDIWVREEMAFADLRREARDPERVFYRNRRENVERKTGNIADFCAAWGDRYTYMIVLDADSIMTGRCLVDLVRLMEEHPSAGIIQAPPMPVNRRTLFGRLHQFAAHAYSSVFVAGLNFWQGDAGNYWGHNAIIRVRPFCEHCRLPKLPGREPLGGSILSHDFVEAAFMRRAGWKVYLATALGGSYEELPSSLINYVARDQRWCQGNLQHIRLLLTPRFHFVNRLHIAMGVMSYMASPLWLMMMGLTTFYGIKETLGTHAYFPKARALFPTWHVSVEQQALALFGLVMVLLLLPKFLSLFLLLRDGGHARRFGGRLRLTTSVLCETLYSTLLAPNLALLQTRFVIAVFMGKKVKWEGQERRDVGTTFGEALRRHWPSTLFGIVWPVLLLLTVPRLFWWFSPVIAGLLLAVPLSAWSSRIAAGEKARTGGLLLTPEELSPPSILQRVHEELEQAPSRLWAKEKDGLAWVLQDDHVRSQHLALLSALAEPNPPLQQHHLEGLALKLGQRGLETLTPREKRELLLEPEIILRLARKGQAAKTPDPHVGTDGLPLAAA